VYIVSAVVFMNGSYRYKNLKCYIFIYLMCFCVVIGYLSGSIGTLEA